MVIILLKSIGNLQTKYNQDWALVLESSKVICIQCRRKTAVFNFKEANYTNHQSSLVCNEPLTIQLFVIVIWPIIEGKFVVLNCVGGEGDGIEVADLPLRSLSCCCGCCCCCCCCCCSRIPFTRLDIEKKDIFDPLVEPLLEVTFEGGDKLGREVGVAGWRGKTIPPPGEKRLLGGRDRSIRLEKRFSRFH